MEKRYRLRFYGSVQGVGFRFTAPHAATMYRLTGYVKNEYDGSVTCEVQGKEADIEQFIATIYHGRFIEIDRIDRTSLELDNDERSFEVRF
jgi:acylphosphatase